MGSSLTSRTRASFCSAVPHSACTPGRILTGAGAGLDAWKGRASAQVAH